MVSIKDIARACAVTPSTVSRALNRRAGVSDKVREQILNKARELGYRRHEAAASLVTAQSPHIGLVIPDIVNPYYALMAKGVTAYAAAHGFTTILCNADRDANRERSAFERLCAARVAGVIVASVTATEKMLGIFRDYGIPVVAAENPLGPDITAVCNDNYAGACQLFEHLMAQGCERLVFATSLHSAFSSSERERACHDVLKAHGMSHKLIATLKIGSTFEEGYAGMEEILSYKPDAIFAINDLMALGMLSYAQEHGIAIPKSVKLAGFDDLPLSSMVSVPLTTVHQRKIQLGLKAAEVLLHEIEHPQSEPSRIMLLPYLVKRASLGESYTRFGGAKQDFKRDFE